MIVKNKTSKIYSYIRSGVVACLLPVFFIYILVGKPDYHIMNSLTGIVVPAASFIGDGITFPFRMIGRAANNIRERGVAARENRVLRSKLDDALRQQNEYQVILEENVRLKQRLNMVESLPVQTVSADILHDNSVIAHASFIIRAGTNSGIKPGCAVISPSGDMIGVVSTVSAASAKVRALSDTKSNIPVRVTGTDVYGFLAGAGASNPSFEFYSDPEFVPTVGNRLITSGIKGSLPPGIPVGTISRTFRTSADVRLNTTVQKLHNVIVLLFDDGDRYK